MWFMAINVIDEKFARLNPFGSLTLQDYLDKAWMLRQTRNIFVMTDDGDWLRAELSECLFSAQFTRHFILIRIRWLVTASHTHLQASIVSLSIARS
jgi:hypothetical protein